VVKEVRCIIDWLFVTGASPVVCDEQLGD